MVNALSGSSTIYRNGRSFFSFESPNRKRVDLFINSSYIPSFKYPDVVQLKRRASGLAPIPLFMTSYCFNPASPCHDAISSQMHNEGLNPSDRFELNAIFFTCPLLMGRYKSDCLCRGISSMNRLAWASPCLLPLNSSSCFWSALYPGSTITCCQMLL